MRLSNIQELSVRPTSSVLDFEDGNFEMERMKRKLQVDAVIEGTIVEFANEVRVTARLVRLSDSSTIWSQQFSQSRDNEADLQHEIALSVADALAINLSGDERHSLTKRYTESGDAMRLYQRGRYHWNKRSKEGIVEAQRLFRNAVDMDRNFAAAYVGIADTLIFGFEIDEAAAAVDRALNLDPNLSEAYATRGFIHMFHGWDWARAESDLKRAIEINPGYATAHQWYASLLMIRGRHEDAKAKLKDALAINPMSYNLLSDLAQAHYYAGDYARAAEYGSRALELYPDFLPAHGILSDVYFQMGENDKAINEKVLQLGLLSVEPNQTKEQSSAAMRAADEHLAIYRRVGIEGYWKLIAREPEASSKNANKFISSARAYLNIGEPEKALDLLEKAVSERAFLAPFISADPVWNSMRSDARFKNILGRMNL
ncbi:MAG: FlgO family outer membrane protein [bacterium]|nr:FlgO family outer membrane protein [bacterium]